MPSSSHPVSEICCRQLSERLARPSAAPVPRFPALATDRVANLLLAYKSRSSAFAPGRAAEDIARQTARDALGPLLDAACARLAFVLRRVVEAASDRALATGECAGEERARGEATGFEMDSRRASDVVSPAPPLRLVRPLHLPCASSDVVPPAPSCPRQQQGHAAALRVLPRGPEGSLPVVPLPPR